MRMPRTIRFDGSDEHVFERAAAPDEWAVSGAFAFASMDAGAIGGKTRQAFANGFLGLASFGRSTFVAVAEISPAAQEAATRGLAAHFVEFYGAPDLDAALPVAADEIAFAAQLCEEHPINTLIAVSREFGDDGEIREAFRVIAPPGEKPHARIWDVEEAE
ncbi:MAG: DUF6505 family protein [Flavobacteriaceae bacterium]